MRAVKRKMRARARGAPFLAARLLRRGTKNTTPPHLGAAYEQFSPPTLLPMRDDGHNIAGATAASASALLRIYASRAA